MNEQELIENYFQSELIQGVNIQTGIGDDAAVLESKGALAMSMDSLVEGRHFRTNEEASSVGHKSLAVNLSDLAAMGSTPRWAMLSLSLPEKTRLQWIENFTRGFFDLAKRWQVALIGGDLVRGPLLITVQITGEVGAEGPLLRSNAQVGDKIYLTGNVGGAGVAWHRPDCLSKDKIAAQNCLERLLRPTPRVAEGISLAKFANAAIDISDGVLLDLSRMLMASNVGAALNLDSIPLTQGVDKLLEKQDWLLPLTAGDDYELLFTMPAKYEAAMREALDRHKTQVTEIGEITAEKKFCCMRNGEEMELPDKLGFDHFSD